MNRNNSPNRPTDREQGQRAQGPRPEQMRNSGAQPRQAQGAPTPSKEEWMARRVAQMKARAKKEKEAEHERQKRQRAADRAAIRSAKKKAKATKKMKERDERYFLTEEERQIRKQMQEEERAYIKRRRLRRTKVFANRFLLFLGTFIALLGISIGLFYPNLVSYEASARRSYSYQVGGKSGNTYSVAHDKMMRRGSLYVNMTPIADLCEMAITGDRAELRYISRNAKEHVQFIVVSRQCFINGVEVRLTASPILDGDDLYVPYSFFTSYVEGLDVSYDSAKNRVSIEKALAEGTGTYQDLTFVIRSDAPMQMLDEYTEFGSSAPIEFLANLDLYEEYMNPKNRDDYLILVNSQYPLPQSYKPETEKLDYSDMLLYGQPDQYLNSVAYKAAHAMIMELAANGFEDTKIHLAYRSYAAQNHYFNTIVKDYMKTMSEEQATIAAASVAQAAGCNPQQAGLSMILHNQEEATVAFSRQPAYAWLADNAWKFGFIIRYPADKTAETGMSFQPYFFTFVGRYHAMRIYEAGLSMEEYIAQLEARGCFGNRTYEEFRETLIS